MNDEDYDWLGCVEYGNNNFFEIGRKKAGGAIIAAPHNDPGVELSIEEFINEVPDIYQQEMYDDIKSLIK